MISVRILPLEKSVSAHVEESVLSALQRAGVEIESPCNGQGICGKCRIWVENAQAIPQTPHKNISQGQATEGLRLACRVVPVEDVTVRLPEGFALDARILEGERISSMRLDPAVRILDETGGHFLYYDREPRPERLRTWRPGLLPKGLAVDIGTTTLVVSLVSLTEGEELATASSLNPQTRFGHDVLSRIQKGSTPAGLSELAGVVRAALNRLVKQVCAASNSDPAEIMDVVVGGNTTMLQLAAEIDPEPLGRLPFTVGIRGGATAPAARFGLEANPQAKVYVPPIAHAFVGSDISAGLASCDEFFTSDEPVLFVDIGTNGEMGLSANGQWLVASTAAGPAFEGMGVSSGMRAAPGAVEAVGTDGQSIEIRTVDDVVPKGICGSGIIDLVACLLRLGVVDASGRMRSAADREGLAAPVAERLEDMQGKPAFRLGEGVYFTQEDVRQLQLAKSAIRTGIDMLLSETGTQLLSLKTLILAGAFGYHLRPESLEAIGLIPKESAKKVRFAGNTSRTGCAQMLLDASVRRLLEERMTKVRHIPLAGGLEFQERFVENLEFPVSLG